MSSALPVPRVLRRDDPDYPSRVHDLGARAPRELFALGERPWPDIPLATIVGARAASPYGRGVTARLVAHLVAAGVGVVSGLARGIDGAAHRATLARGGWTVAVLGVGIDQVYPPEHASLYTRVAAAGRILSPWAPGAPAKRHHFPARNRILAALGDVTILVQADARSGSRHTVQAALALGRGVLVVPWPLGHDAYEGNARWVRAGRARVLSALEDAAIAAREGFARRARARAMPATDEARLLLALSSRPRGLEDLARACALTIGMAAAGLTALELQGRAERAGSDRYRLRGCR